MNFLSTTVQADQLKSRPIGLLSPPAVDDVQAARLFASVVAAWEGLARPTGTFVPSRVVSTLPRLPLVQGEAGRFPSTNDVLQVLSENSAQNDAVRTNCNILAMPFVCCGSSWEAWFEPMLMLMSALQEHALNVSCLPILLTSGPIRRQELTSAWRAVDSHPATFEGLVLLTATRGAEAVSEPQLAGEALRAAWQFGQLPAGRRRLILRRLGGLAHAQSSRLMDPTDFVAGRAAAHLVAISLSEAVDIRRAELTMAEREEAWARADEAVQEANEVTAVEEIVNELRSLMESMERDQCQPMREPKLTVTERAAALDGMAAATVELAQSLVEAVRATVSRRSNALRERLRDLVRGAIEQEPSQWQLAEAIVAAAEDLVRAQRVADQPVNIARGPRESPMEDQLAATAPGLQWPETPGQALVDFGSQLPASGAVFTSTLFVFAGVFWVVREVLRRSHPELGASLVIGAVVVAACAGLLPGLAMCVTRVAVERRRRRYLDALQQMVSAWVEEVVTWGCGRLRIGALEQAVADVRAQLQAGLESWEQARQQANIAMEISTNEAQLPALADRNEAERLAVQFADARRPSDCAIEAGRQLAERPGGILGQLPPAIVSAYGSAAEWLLEPEIEPLRQYIDRELRRDWPRLIEGIPPAVRSFLPSGGAWETILYLPSRWTDQTIGDVAQIIPVKEAEFGSLTLTSAGHLTEGNSVSWPESIEVEF